MKICIVGPSGAGKTTLSKKLEKELNISAYAFDGIYWNLSGTVFIKNSEEIISYGIKQIGLTHYHL
ncbi:AAA family ATPase [Acinetobacter baumannii]|uniref:AAA family ATPase n=1 Tax=Acinetobacter baumannii TaxID=470 RepID=UPI0036F873DC